MAFAATFVAYSYRSKGKMSAQSAGQLNNRVPPAKQAAFKRNMMLMKVITTEYFGRGGYRRRETADSDFSRIVDPGVMNQGASLPICSSRRLG